MNLRDLLTSAITNLPRKREQKLMLPDQLAQMCTEYLEALKTLDIGDPVCKSVQPHLDLIKDESCLIRSAISIYLDGSPHRAYDRLREALEKLRPFLERLKAPRNKLLNLYRVREIDDLAEKERKDIFHVPFDLRHKIGTKRYSIPGWPSLYLGGSLLVCWEEMARPPFHTLTMAAFDGKSNLSVLDFGYRPAVAIDLHEKDSFFVDDQMTSYLVCWPLLAACALSVQHRGSSFIEEYIVPQLLLQWLMEEATDIDGLRYFSTRLNQIWPAPELAINYVFPVKPNNRAELSKKFEFTLPVPWVLLEGIEPRSMSSPRQNKPYLFSPGVELSYDDTIFGKLEERIAYIPKATLGGTVLAK